MGKLQYRVSGIELLKVIAMLLIVQSHVVMTLHSSFDFLSFNEYVLDFGQTANGLRNVILSTLSFSGDVGNLIFFISSAWFLLDFDCVNKKKIFQIILDVWIVSVIILIITVYFGRCEIGKKYLVYQLFPTYFGNNWYLTCYILFYAFHPFLNIIIKQISKKTLLVLSVSMFLMYSVLQCFFAGCFMYSILILWVTIYFVLAYMKLYLCKLSNSKGFNLFLVLFGLISTFCLVLLTNELGYKISFLRDKLMRWGGSSSPLIILSCIGLFNLARNISFNNIIINYISSLSMLVYIIHENKILREYYRPQIWQWVYINYGYDNVILWVFILTVIIFVLALFASILYKYTIQKMSIKLNSYIYPPLSNICSRLIGKIMEIE